MANANESSDPANRFILTATGPSSRGQVAALGQFVNERQGYIEEFEQFDDPKTKRFFGRIVFTLETPEQASRLQEESRRACRAVQLDTFVHSDRERPRVMILVSRKDHCLRDLLYRHGKGELAMEITAVVSNHPDLEWMAAEYGIRFVHLPVDNETRSQQEEQLKSLIEETQSELMILARYMQILTDPMVRYLEGRAINIHHSFLPGFKGGRPYRQAYERGVKLIGATAHFVTADLDEGPIIEQIVDRVDHKALPTSLATKGRDCESHALARAITYYLDRRLFLNENRTVIL